jgi:hypothetical protein
MSRRSITATLALAACVAAAAGCGSDADCGACPEGGACPAACESQHDCVPDCSAVTCGPDPVCGASCGVCPSPIQSTFDVDAEGWTLRGYNTDVPGWSLDDFLDDVPVFDPSGGHPGGALTRDEAIIGRTEYFSAPSRFLGDLSAFYGGTLRFELRQAEVESPFYGPIVILSGSSETLILDQDGDPGVDWTARSVELAADAGWKRHGDGALVTESELREVLAQVTAMRIRGEFNGFLDESWFDNVVLGP